VLTVADKFGQSQIWVGKQEVGPEAPENTPYPWNPCGSAECPIRDTPFLFVFHAFYDFDSFLFLFLLFL